jgi:hypothetical protein
MAPAPRREPIARYKPLVVLTAGNVDDEGLAPDAARVTQAWQEMQAEQPRHFVEQHVSAPKSGHFIQYDSPELVIAGGARGGGGGSRARPRRPNAASSTQRRFVGLRLEPRGSPKSGQARSSEKRPKGSDETGR